MAKRRYPLTAADGAWWQMEQPTNLMTITAVFTFRERTPIAVMRRLVEERLLKFDRFRQRVVRPTALARPHWEDDPTFDIDEHLKAADLEGTVDQETLEQYVGKLMSTPLPKSRPLWQVHFVERYGHGSAFVARVHHCIADGMSLVQVLLNLADEKPSFVVPRKRHTRAHKAEGGMLLPARKVVDAFTATGGLARAVAGVLDLRADPRTPFRGRLGRAKLAVWSRPIPLEDVRRIGKHVGATLNDVLLSAVSGALKHYLEHRGEDASEMTLHAVVPVNLRAPDDVALGNKFGMVFLPLPVGGKSALDRLQLTKRAMDRIKRSPEAVVIFGLLRALGAAAMSLIETAVNLLGRKATAVMTNVPGPLEPVRFFGAEVDSMMFWVPQSGKLGMGVSILSYCGQVRVGLAVDRGLVPDPEVIVDGFHRAIEELAASHAEHAHGHHHHASRTSGKKRAHKA